MTKLNKPKWLTYAETQLGVHEGIGKANNPTVVQYFVDASHPEVHNDETPWCAAFVGATLKRCGIKSSESLMARSYEKWGQSTPGVLNPVLGCVGVKTRKGAGWVGHVGFVVAANKTTVWLLGGNTDDQVKVSAYKRSEFTAFRWPANVSIPGDLSPLPTSFGGSATESKQS